MPVERLGGRSRPAKLHGGRYPSVEDNKDGGVEGGGGGGLGLSGSLMGLAGSSTGFFFFSDLFIYRGRQANTFVSA
jgi:hypothetical protein